MRSYSHVSEDERDQIGREARAFLHCGLIDAKGATVVTDKLTEAPFVGFVSSSSRCFSWSRVLSRAR